MSMNLRIGVDVGGTNTDSVLINPLKLNDADRGILAWYKTATTKDVSSGIQVAIKALFSKCPEVKASSINAVVIGTTHFINAVIEQDERRLAPVGIIRLCGPYTRFNHPFIDFPENLANLICGYYAYVDGGYQVDGELIKELNEEEIRNHVLEMKARKLQNIVIMGVFSPINHSQEDEAARIVMKEMPDAKVVKSYEVANLGYLERENASILNASILQFARRTIISFQHAIKALNLDCPVYLTQNDGTLVSAEAAANFPIRTFNSGPTNSMRGAALLSAEGSGEKQPYIVVDIGGTTTDVGYLLPTGLPRQAAAYTTIGGVRMNFSMPDVQSIGLGGGSIVRKLSSGKISVGPDSVGHELETRALVFGGETITTTDVAVAIQNNLSVGDVSKVSGRFSEEYFLSYKIEINRLLEKIIDRIKTSPEDIPVLLVGGGSLISPSSIKGVSRIIRPPFHEVANAVGAALAKVSAVIDTVVSTDKVPLAEVLEQLSRNVVDNVVANGAIRETIVIAEIDSFPLPYIANKVRVVIKGIGEFDFSKKFRVPVYSSFDMPIQDTLAPDRKADLGKQEIQTPTLDILGYRPTVKEGVWTISETDLEWITQGCYILGTGGGGTPYTTFLYLRDQIRQGAIMRIIAPESLAEGDLIAHGGGMGSPTIAMERLKGPEYFLAHKSLYSFIGKEPDAIIAIEIGGHNGLYSLAIGSSKCTNIPVLDGDFMGRAYPTMWQTTPCILGDVTHYLPALMTDGNGNKMLMLEATSTKMIEKAFRAALAEMGSSVGVALGPLLGKDAKHCVVPNTMSLSWRIGRAVACARTTNSIDFVADAIVAECGGEKSSRFVFRGKVVHIDRRLWKGHVYGEVIIESDKDDTRFDGRVTIPFKNENMWVKHTSPCGEDKMLVVVPDLVCVIDSQNGDNIGTPEYRYGLNVSVIGIQAHPHWTDSQKGMDFGGPKAFGFDDVEYHPIGVYTTPRSVIEEYGS
ncbi:Hydantoin utilization protein A [Neolecta irregularis DAH-3]|uniref:Hydantoin utilization protein A n=1 Tax=Neolecta irregularis (strain DAH-3) TaxID=1198029 RepID=A0A1U7LWA2_NEOID|nr:Hydantoin utilization protein A [Neolecta irregularis DAH-3]|eukprot:OLL26914.1 Hydantoin utilization protein A [Neolecta irregularis DAH-3]